ncbi:MAG TPA: DUF3592 domain-containing protein [Candidatus Binatia bacterium]|nr:DUF3592 domain-containing protein [Candidatus Binatia bacterium]
MVNARGGKQAGACVGIVFLFFGLAMLVGGGYWAVRTQRFIGSAEKAQGRVIALVPHSGSKGGTTYAPTVQYTTKDGQATTFTSSTSSSPPAHREGDIVTVLYDPAKPDKAEINAFTDLWLGPLIVGIMGAIFTLIAIATILQGARAFAQRRRLRENGLRIAAAVEGVEAMPGGGYTLVAKATDPRGVPRMFRSDPVTADPGPKMLGRSSVEVIVDPDDYGNYEVDLAFLRQ